MAFAHLPIHSETLRGQVMHDLGEWAETHRSSPGLRESRRFAAARGNAVNASQQLIAFIASQSIRDWRATRRAKNAQANASFSSVYPRGVGSQDIVGVRVILTVQYPRGRPAGARDTVSVLINAQGSDTVEQIGLLAKAAWNNAMIQTPHGSDRLAQAVDWNIVQVVEGGWGHAQIGRGT
jgi:hypothetical protein